MMLWLRTKVRSAVNNFLEGLKMAEKTTHLTKEGLAKIEKELTERKSQRRMDIAEKIKVAIAFGDISENSEYDEAKKEQAENEARISELEEKLQNVVLIDETAIDTTKVGLGAKIVLMDVDDGTKEEYQLVGSSEANPMEGKISNESPVGAAIMGNRRMILLLFLPLLEILSIR